ncbi:hypothetical protein B0H63DRAFT_426919 [Podospora didyma]|uniref:Smr domain-containing protein n=1 Tax=Podospora didyma TaxID=330526 RepID=A0AAE0U8P6_9PEZI|nr:hypothetical protein B0H63DRAFT_426919 [Podospora didyma]
MGRKKKVVPSQEPPPNRVEIENLLKKKLIDEFAAVLEEPLILAIVSEREDIKAKYDEIRSILVSLADSSGAEAATGFDPSGLGCLPDDFESLGFDGTASVNGMSNGGKSLTATDNTTTVSESSGASISSGSSGSSGSAPLFTDQENVCESDKVENLRLIFPNFNDHTIRFTLKDSRGDLERAFDLLLNRQFLEESGELLKGVDSFFVHDEDERQPKKGKTNAKRSKPTKGKKKLALDYTVVSPTIDDEELEGAKGPVQLPRSRILGPSRPVVSSSASRATPTNYDDDWQRSHFRAAAAGLNRMGPLGRQGASVYIGRAQESARQQAACVSSLAEQHVDRQSTADKIDLHGVTVLDGVRIAKHRVWRWWDSLGEFREAKARRDSFTVVTGVGHHSANGVSRLRQAVGAALKNDGWKVEVGTGQYFISGRARSVSSP